MCDKIVTGQLRAVTAPSPVAPDPARLRCDTGSHRRRPGRRNRSPRDHGRAEIPQADPISGTPGARPVTSRVIGSQAAHPHRPRVPGIIGRPYGAPIVRTADAGYAHLMVGMGSSLAMTTLPDQTGVPPERALDCGELVHSHPWAATSLGPAEAWDPVVRATVDMLLASPVPMVLAYGDDHVLVYNDAYAEVLGARHPAALGRPAADVFGALWLTPGVGGVIEDVYRSGQPFLEAETQVAVARGGPGHVEQASFTRGHSVIRDVRGDVVGVLTVAAETTQ